MELIGLLDEIYQLTKDSLSGKNMVALQRKTQQLVEEARTYLIKIERTWGNEELPCEVSLPIPKRDFWDDFLPVSMAEHKQPIVITRFLFKFCEYAKEIMECVVYCVVNKKLQNQEPMLRHNIREALESAIFIAKLLNDNLKKD